MTIRKNPSMIALTLATVFVLFGMTLCAGLAMGGKWAMGLILLVFSASASLFALSNLEDE
ncbi:MAG: hypothetical protein Q4A06_02625 [Cardiobacteriaceae bacterium]|nr:hypothetical protein [Cardiobacteriaceae bacterium]